MTVTLGGWPYPKPRDPRLRAPDSFLRTIGARTHLDHAGVLTRPDPQPSTSTNTET